MTREELFHLQAKQIDRRIYDKTKQRWDSISKPIDGLGSFEKWIAQIFAIQGVEQITGFKKVLAVFCADHGIVEEGVSQCGQEVTYQVAKLLGEDRSTASKMARFAKTDCIPVDVGINSPDKLPGVRDEKVRRGTGNFLKEEAMTEQEAIDAINVGIQIARECKEKGYHILATGEMGIGNTTSGTALLCALTGTDVAEVVGRGAGLSDSGLAKKKKVIETALAKYEFVESTQRAYALQVLHQVGGLEIAAMAGTFLGGAVYGIPVMIDGVLSAVAALIAAMLMPECVAYMLPSHAGREKGTKMILERLGLSPILTADMALGEGTGALMVLPLLDMALDFFLQATTFAEGGIEQYTRQ